MVTVAGGSEMHWNDYGRHRARVFLSCGQRPAEQAVVTAVRDLLTEKGYDVYVATAAQSLTALVENVYREIEDSEYFLFIDFARSGAGSGLLRRLWSSSQGRPSLFSHQELAIASFLRRDVIVLQEEGLQREGLIEFLQANAVTFTDREQIPSIIAAQLGKNGWRPDWRRQLVLGRRPSEYVDAHFRGAGGGGAARYFHIAVKNLDPGRAARNCLVYLSGYQVLDNDASLKDEWRPVETIEFKWEGYTLPNATILPGGTRLFDAAACLLLAPARAQFSVFTDSTRYIPPIRDPGRYRIRFTVHSDNFSPASASFLLTVASDLAGWELRLDQELSNQ